MNDTPLPGNLRGWAITWQVRAALLAYNAREWMDRDAEIAKAYQDAAEIQYARARELIHALMYGVRP